MWDAGVDHQGHSDDSQGGAEAAAPVQCVLTPLDRVHKGK